MLLRNFPDKSNFVSLAEEFNVIPVCTEVLADMETPVSLLQKACGAGGPVFLLESVEGGEKWGRYSFLGTSARAHVRVYKEYVEIQRKAEKEKILHHNDPLKVLKDFMGRYNPAPVSGLPRFWGGLVGSINYEMVSFFEAIDNELPLDKPLAHFIISDELIIFDNIRNTLMCLVIAFPEGPADARKAYENAKDRLAGLLELMQQPIQKSNLGDRQGPFQLQTPLPEEDFRERVVKVKEYIREGDIFQGVISQPFVCDAPRDILSLYRAQRFINPSPYLFFFDYGEGTLVGSSPETMVRLENNVATLRPIAGTRPRGANERRDRELADELLGDEKEKAEHLMLVDLGRNDLGRVAVTGTVQVTDLMIVERYSHVMHLVSNINCDLKEDCDAWDLLRATFPAGTLSGAPKVRAMEIISELENSPRGPYGGAVGYVCFSGNMDLAITIRTAFIQEGRLIVRAGAGIVADSDPETERLETVNKAKAIQKAIQLIRA
jgi:anthranilate synthase component 1